MRLPPGTRRLHVRETPTGDWSKERVTRVAAAKGNACVGCKALDHMLCFIKERSDRGDALEEVFEGFEGFERKVDILSIPYSPPSAPQSRAAARCRALASGRFGRRSESRARASIRSPGNRSRSRPRQRRNFTTGARPRTLLDKKQEGWQHRATRFNEGGVGGVGPSSRIPTIAEVCLPARPARPNRRASAGRSDHRRSRPDHAKAMRVVINSITPDRIVAEPRPHHPGCSAACFVMMAPRSVPRPASVPPAAAPDSVPAPGAALPSAGTGN